MQAGNNNHRFLSKATTYEDFFLTSSLSNIKAFKSVFDDYLQTDTLFALNGTGTKMIFVQQPFILDNLFLDKISIKDKD